MRGGQSTRVLRFGAAAILFAGISAKKLVRKWKNMVYLTIS
jgi:hypothetical protein